MQPRWFKSSTIYCVAVETFRDANGDGWGDLAGLTASLGYLQDLGVDCLWLEPFYPSPMRDNGYDVADHREVHPRLGTLRDFDALIAEADRRGMAVLVDLVLNHTSDQHPWFQSARADSDSEFRDYYIWTDDPEAHPETNAFPTEQDSPWTFDEAAGRWYLHRFFSHEPDLDVANPRVEEEMWRTVKFWLDRGVAGFRVDASQFLVEKLAERDDPDPHRLLREMRAIVSGHRSDGVLLAEADVEMDQLPDYFGQNDEMQLLFNFYLDANLFLALARRQAEPVEEILRRLPRVPLEGHWANFVRNQDELNLTHLSEDERADVFDAFAPNDDERIFGRGIRRRLAPMLGGDRRRAGLVYSVLLSLPGAAVLGYGDELGMGDDLGLPERYAVRTPMQWSATGNAGFSDAPAGALIRPVVSTGPFGHEHLNVDAQLADDNSLLRWFQRAVRSRRDHPEISLGEARTIDTGDPAVLAQRYGLGGGGLLVLHNFSDEARSIGFESSELPRDAADLFADADYPGPEDGRIDLGPYGYRWLA